MKLFQRIYSNNMLLFANLLVVTIGLSFFYDKAVFVVAFFCFILLTVITFMKTEVAILSILIWSYFQYLFTKDLKMLPEPFNLIGECFLASILVYLAWKLWDRKIIIKWSFFDIALISFVFVGILSSILNKNPIQNTILGLRCYIQYIILYYALSYLDIPDRFHRLILNTMLALVLIQVPFTIYQYYTWTASSLVNDHADAAYGTFSFGSANMLGILMLTFIAYLYKIKNDMSLLAKLISILLLCFSMILAHSKISYILLIIILIYDNLGNLKARLNVTKTVLILFSLFIIAKIALLVSDDFANLLSYDNWSILIENQIEDKEGGGRIMYLLLTFSILYKYAYSYLIGLGPGMFASYAGITLKSHYLVDVLNIDLEHRGTRLDADIIGVLGEYGYLGFILFSFMLTTFLIRKMNCFKLSDSSYWQSYSEWFKLFTIIFFLGAFVNGIWQAKYFAATFWIAAGIYNKKYLESVA